MFTCRFLCEHMLSVLLVIPVWYVYFTSEKSHCQIVGLEKLASLVLSYSAMGRPAPEPSSYSYLPNFKIDLNKKHTSSKVRDQDVNWLQTSHEQTMKE